MAKLYVSEYTDLAAAGANRMLIGPMGLEPSTENANSPITIGAEAKSAAFGTDTRFIRVHADAICSITIAPAPGTAATTSAKRLAANQTEYFGVKPGQILSVIANT